MGPKKGKGKQNNGGGKKGGGGAAGASMTTPQPDGIIIAIDFGTTYSGIAWAHTASDRTRPITEWPPNSKTFPKVPTVLAYNTTELDQPPRWGFDIPQPAKWQRVEWFKLLLNENCATTGELLTKVEKGLTGYKDQMDLEYIKRAIQDIPEGKHPVDLVTDFLKALFQYAKTRLVDAYPELKEELDGQKTPLTFYLTVPAIWDDKAKHLTKQAALNAGLGQSGAQIHMISEPEAAAIHCLPDMQLRPDSLSVGDVFVITDCGGGTVDLISYQVTEVKPKLQVMECTIGSGGLCGSTSINRRFDALVQGRIGKEAFDALSRENLEKMRGDFERLKCDYTILEEDEDEDDSENDKTCQLFGVQDQPDKGIEHGEIRLKYRELTELFRQTFEEITTLVQKQISDAENESKRNVKAVVLVGGLGGSSYLKTWLESKLRSRDGKTVLIIKPENPTLAIVNGAIAHGVAMHKAGNVSGLGPCTGSMIRSRKARFHYGIMVSKPFDEAKHPLDKMVLHPFLGILMCTGRMTWFVKKGDDLSTGDPKSIEFSRLGPIHIPPGESTDSIYFSEADEPPESVEDTKLLCTYSVDLRMVPLNIIRGSGAFGGFRTPFWDIHCSIQMTFQSASLEFLAKCGNKVVGKITTDFNHSGSGGSKHTPCGNCGSCSHPNADQDCDDDAED